MDTNLYDEYNAFENKHWWFQSRKKIFSSLIKNFFDKDGNATSLDIGCGTGSNMEFLSRYSRVFGVDMSTEAIKYCSSKGYPLCQADLSILPFKTDRFDLVTILDVVEHFDDDYAALKEIERITKPGGLVVISVPAFQFLWGEHDELAHHKRRYNAGQLGKVVEKAGFEIEKMTYNNFFLFPAGVIYRYLKKIERLTNKNKEKTSDFGNTAPPVINTLFKYIYSAEAVFLKYMRFPFGLSLVCVCRKK